MAKSAKPYLKAITAYEAEFEGWEKKCDKIVKRYRDERDALDKASQRFNIFWSNIEIMGSVLFAKLPKPEVERRFRDKDHIGRMASKVIERAVLYEIDTGGFETVMEQIVCDYLLTGRGTSWEIYDPTIEGKEKTEEKTETIFLGYSEFGHDVCRRWSEVKKVWRKVWFTKEAAKKRWPKVDADELEYGTDYVDEKTKTEDMQKKTCVYEMWDSSSRKVYWLSKNQKNCLEEYDFPLNLRNKFPCPPPVYATKTNDTLKPVPDYLQYQDQLLQIDRLTARIGNLSDALKIVGVYDTTIPALQRLLHPDGVADNTLVPVKNWKEFAQKGGLEGAFDIVPIKEVAEALIHCYTALDHAKQILYEVTGLADIMRGATDPNETLGAQELKSRHGSIRIRKRQNSIANFARDILRIKAEIICENFEPETLWDMVNAETFIEPLPELAQSQMPIPPEQAKQITFQKAIDLLRDDRMRTFRLDVETDSTIQLDEVQAKQDAVEFVTAVGQFISSSAEIVAMDPRIAPLAGETLSYLARQYKAGRQLEGAIENYVEQLRQPQPQKPDPEQVKAQAKQQELAMKLKVEQEKARLKLEEMKAKLQLEMAKLELDRQNMEQKAALERMIAEQELEIKARQMMIDQAESEQQMEMQRQEGQQRMAMEREQGSQQMAMQREKNMMDNEAKREAARAKTRAA